MTTDVVLIISLFSQKKKQIADVMRQLAGPVRLLFATEAYGMGADAPDIRHIFHIGPPNSIECKYDLSYKMHTLILNSEHNATNRACH